MQSARRLDPTLVLPAAAVGIVGAAAFLWRTLTWQSGASPDAWAYAAWGQALASGERPLFDLSETTPKPLGTFLGLLVAPLPGERAFSVVVALSLGVLAASLFAAAYREGGAVAAAVSIVVLAASAQLGLTIGFAYVDAVVAPLLLTGIALRGRLRIAALVLAGLLRPEAWPLAAVAGFTETSRSRSRRVVGALVAGAAAPLLWMLGDLVLIGDPLGTQHWRSERHGEQSLGTTAWLEIPRLFLTALRTEGGAVLTVVGFLGLLVHYLRARREGSADPLPLAVVVGWSLLVALERRFGVELNSRYLFPVVVVLALGCGLLAAAVLPSRLGARSPWPAVVVAAGALVFIAVSMDLDHRVQRQMDRNDAIAATGPTVEAVLLCGRLGLTGGRPARAMAPSLAASTRTPLRELGLYPDGGRFAAVLHVTRGRRVPTNLPLPPWPRRSTPVGPLAVSPGCAAVG
jgi:hypothetical protein